jgi:hypothetical protein
VAPGWPGRPSPQEASEVLQDTYAFAITSDPFSLGGGFIAERNSLSYVPPERPMFEVNDESCFWPRANCEAGTTTG